MLWKIYLCALVIRWIYVLALFSTLGAVGLQGTDSFGYLEDAYRLADEILQGNAKGLDWLGHNTGVMPLFSWLLVLHVLSFGTFTPLAYVLTQCAIDAGTCVIIYYLTQTLNQRYAFPAAIAACFNPTQIVLSGFVYTDTPFLFLVALFLLASLRWLAQPSWLWAITLGLSVASAAMIRVLAAPWVPFLLLLLIIVTVWRRRHWRLAAVQVISVAAIVILFLSPVLWRNVERFGTWALTSQGGLHLALWVVPLVKESMDGTPWQTSYDAMQKRVLDRYPVSTPNSFEGSRRYTAIGREALAELGLLAIAKAWLTGAAINVAAPAVILSPPVSRLPRTGFYSTPGASPLEKIRNFLFHSDNTRYAWILLMGIAGVIAISLIQLCGLVVIVRSRQDWAAILLLTSWLGYVLAVNGPVASPKYRLPIEPVLMVLTGAGLTLLRRRTAHAASS